MDYERWEDEYGKHRVTVGDLRKKQVFINGEVRRMKKKLEVLGFRKEVIKEVVEEFKVKMVKSTGHINWINHDFEQILITQRNEFKKMIDDMLLLNSSRWLKKGKNR